jgi:hypothetical protein
MVAWLSQCKEIDDIDYGQNLISNNIFLNHFVSLPVVVRAINLDSIVEWVIHICFFEAQETTPPPKINTHWEVGLLSLVLVI